MTECITQYECVIDHFIHRGISDIQRVGASDNVFDAESPHLFAFLTDLSE